MVLGVISMVKVMKGRDWRELVAGLSDPVTEFSEHIMLYGNSWETSVFIWYKIFPSN